MSKHFFWKDTYVEGSVAEGGLFVRTDLGTLFDKIRKQSGREIIGFIIDDEDPWNLEFLCQPKTITEADVINKTEGEG